MFYFIKIILTVILFNQNAYAYLDGGTSGMLLQLLFGGVAGGWFIIKMYWNKLKQRLLKTKLSEESNKESITSSKNLTKKDNK